MSVDQYYKKDVEVNDFSSGRGLRFGRNRAVKLADRRTPPAKTQVTS